MLGLTSMPKRYRIILILLTVACGVCGAQVQELRRGRCWDCYRQWAELRPVGSGASCGQSRALTALGYVLGGAVSGALAGWFWPLR